MQSTVCVTAEAAAKAAAECMTHDARAAIAARGRCVVAVSGGRTPWRMLEEWRRSNLLWKHVHVFQVDERVVPRDHAARNLTPILRSLHPSEKRGGPQVHPMPVDDADLESAARHYADTLRSLTGASGVLDLVQLGLGADGHTASLVPDDPLLDATDPVDVGITGVYQQHRRMSMTYPVLNRARRILWLVTGMAKAEALAQLLASDQTIPAGRVATENAILFADRSAVTDAPAR